MIVQQAIEQASKILKKNNILSHELDAELILSDIMNIKKELLIIKNKAIVPEKIIKKYKVAINRRIKSEPVAYILGKKEFWSENFIVNHSTLVPRPETELMLYKLIKFFKNRKINILDIGTGSGCILLSILKELNLSRGTGIDISAKAIEIAKINSKKIGLINRAKFRVYDLNKFHLGKYDLIISNPPYIPSMQIKNLSKDIINFEPLSALDGGRDGLDLVKQVIYKSKYLLKNGGMLALEIGHNQYSQVSKQLRYCGYREINREYDLNHNVRCIMSTKVKFF